MDTDAHVHPPSPHTSLIKRHTRAYRHTLLTEKTFQETGTYRHSRPRLGFTTESATTHTEAGLNGQTHGHTHTHAHTTTRCMTSQLLLQPCRTTAHEPSCRQRCCYWTGHITTRCPETMRVMSRPGHTHNPPKAVHSVNNMNARPAAHHHRRRHPHRHPPCDHSHSESKEDLTQQTRVHRCAHPEAHLLGSTLPASPPRPAAASHRRSTPQPLGGPLLQAGMATSALSSKSHHLHDPTHTQRALGSATSCIHAHPDIAGACTHHWSHSTLTPVSHAPQCTAETAPTCHKRLAPYRMYC